MAKDPELDRLKATQDAAFARKQTAYAAQEAAWKRKKTAGDAMNSAFEDKQHAYDAQQRSWESLQRLRDTYGPRIESCNRLQETAFQNMKSSFDSASSAHDRRDGASAKMYAEQGHRYKEESRGYVEERRRLVAELRVAGDNHRAYARAFQAARDRFNDVKREFDAAKSALEHVQAEFKAAKAAFDSAAKAFKDRLNAVKAQNAKKAADKRSIAERAGVPYAYRDKVYISKDANGITQIYFGGVGEPNGLGHGHYTVDASGKVTYKREPFDPHGAQNFADNRRESATRNMAQMAMNQWAKTQTTPRMTQFEDSEFKVDVRAGYSRRYDAITTDVLIYDKQNKREHYHLVIDEHGREIFSEWRPNHR